MNFRDRNWPCSREEFGFFAIWKGNPEGFDGQSDRFWFVFKRSRWLLGIENWLQETTVDAERLVRKLLQHFRGDIVVSRTRKMVRSWGVFRVSVSIDTRICGQIQSNVWKNARFLPWAVKVWEEQSLGGNMEEGKLRVCFWVCLACDAFWILI